MAEDRHGSDSLLSHAPTGVEAGEPVCTFATPPSGETSRAASRHPLSLLVEVNAALAESPDAVAQATLLDSILTRVCDRLGLAYAAIYRLATEARTLRRVAHRGPQGASADVEPLDAPTLPAWVAREAEALYLPPGTRDSRFPGRSASALAEYAVPLRAKDRMLGVLVLAAPRGLRMVTRKLADQFAIQVALALERMELSQQLNTFKERLRSVFEQQRVGVILGNLQGELCEVNAAFAHSLGYEPEELRGRTEAAITHSQDLARSAEALNQLLEGRKPEVVFEKRYLHRSGEAHVFLAAMSLVRDAGQSPAGFLTLLEDPGERKKAEAECAQLREQLMRAQKLAALGRLVGGLAHDFNNLLGVILGFASLLRTGLVPDDPLQGHVRMIEQSGERAADLISQLSGYTRQEVPPAQPQRPDEILQRVVKIVSQTFDRRIRVETRHAPDLPWVEARPGELEQMILNLCLNSRDAMPEGGSLVPEASQVLLGPDDASRPAHCPPGTYVRLAVQDTGVGIEPRVLAHIFEPFFTTKDAGKGSGLGLAMVDTMARSQGGFVRAESEIGRGSCFTLFLPALSHLREKPEGRAPLRGLAQGTGTVLVVDDEPMVLAFVQEGLRKLGYRVLTADTGPRALEIYAGHAAEIDCVLLDLILPEMSGLEIYRRLRALNPSGRVILSPGYTNSPLLREAREAGVAAFITKPYTLEGLGRALQANVPP